MGIGQDLVDDFEPFLVGLGETLTAQPDAWYQVIHLGWWRLLRESPPSVGVDEVLEAGFSPVSWELNIVDCAWALSRAVADKFGTQGSEGDEPSERILASMGLSKTAIESVPHYVSSESCDRALHVLNWEEAVEAFNEVSIKTLGYLWFCDFIREDRIVEQLTAEVEATLVARILDSLGSLTGTNPKDLIRQASAIEEDLSADLRSWTAGFARFPFGV